MENIIEIKNVSFKYSSEEETENYVLNDLSLNIEKGSFTAVLGHNGSGKSTLAKLINGLLKPDSGSVEVLGMSTLDEKKEMEIRRNVGLVFQNPDNQLVATIVEEDVAFGPENLGLPSDEIRRRVDDALKKVDMYDYRSHAPHKLSGGQKQRVAIAGIIAMEPQCIVLDEPTAMLDPKGRDEVMDAIVSLNKNSGITIVLITHFMDEAVKADRVVVMDAGNIIMDDVPRKVFSRVSELKAIGLDVPQATELAYRMNAAGYKMPSDILTEEEFIKEFIKKYA
ncbi:MAG TPA: energy-coupling factor transporter ATPase [Firmicutes bacterium]|nr:energy-coupling factor transporter ATPase [Bacillota bacterium]